MRHGLSARIALRLVFAGVLAVGTLGVVLRSGVATATPGGLDDQQLAALRLPPGFHVNVFAEGLGYVRFMTFSPQGDLVATSSSRELYGERCNGGNCPPNEGRIFILPDRNHRGVADQTVVFADGLDRPLSPGPQASAALRPPRLGSVRAHRPGWANPGRPSRR